ncbi:MAG: hypothetical protein AB1625_06495 [Acidobacteriota bacterium]
MSTNRTARSLTVTAMGLGVLLVLVGANAAHAQNAEEMGGALAASAVVPCGSEGTWLGLADNGFSWMNTITRGTGISNGQVDLAWVSVDPTLFGAFAAATSITPGRGVWRRVDRRHDIQWTWMAYGKAADGTVLYVARVSGTHAMPDCDHIAIAYVLEVFLPQQNMDTEPPVACLQGTGMETRMPLVQASCGP